MPLSPEESFRAAFYYRCAEEGLGPEAAEARARAGLAKLAVWPNLLQAGKSTAELGMLPVYYSAAVPGLLGLLGGYGLARLRQGPLDAKELRRRELIQAYDDEAERAEAEAASGAEGLS